MPNITVNYCDCHLPAEIIEVCVLGNKVDRCSVKLVVTRQTLENSIGLMEQFLPVNMSILCTMYLFISRLNEYI